MNRPTITRLNLGTTPRDRLMFAGAGSGLYETTALGEGQRPRSLLLQDTRRSVDQYTWRKLLAYARQLHSNSGEVRGPVLERAMLANAGGWMPRHMGKLTPKRVRSQYEEWGWNWMRVADIRGQPYDFWTDLFLASVMIDRDGEAPVRYVVNRNGDPRLQWVANHRIYSHTGVWIVQEEGPYKGMRFNNGVVYDEQSAPVAYFILEESMQWSQSIKGTFVPVRNMQVQYNPDWCDQGRGVTAYAHGIKRCFDLDDIHLYTLLGVKRNAAQPIISETEGGPLDAGEAHLTAGVSPGGTAITLEEIEGGLYTHVRANAGTKLTVPTTKFPEREMPEYMENVLIGVYQGLPWPYEFGRMSKEAKGANIRVTVEKVNNYVGMQYSRLERLAVRALGFALGTAVNRGELPPGEWWAWEFPRPPQMTADKWREYQEDRENLKMGVTTLLDIAARRSQHWQEDLRDQRDIEQDDKMQRCERLYVAHRERCQAATPPIEPMSFEFFVQDYEQRSANPTNQKPAEQKPAGATKDDDDDEA